MDPTQPTYQKKKRYRQRRKPSKSTPDPNTSEETPNNQNDKAFKQRNASLMHSSLGEEEDSNRFQEDMPKDETMKKHESVVNKTETKMIKKKHHKRKSKNESNASVVHPSLKKEDGSSVGQEDMPKDETVKKHESAVNETEMKIIKKKHHKRKSKNESNASVMHPSLKNEDGSSLGQDDMPNDVAVEKRDSNVNETKTQMKRKKHHNQKGNSSKSKNRADKKQEKNAEDKHQLLGNLSITLENTSLNEKIMLDLYIRMILQKIERDTGLALKQIHTNTDLKSITADLLATNKPCDVQITHACDIISSFNQPGVTVTFLKVEEINYQYAKADAIKEIEKLWNQCLKKNEDAVLQLEEPLHALANDIAKLRQKQKKLNDTKTFFDLAKDEANLLGEQNKLKEKVKLKEMEGIEFARVCQGFHDEITALDINDKEFAGLLGNIRQKFGAEISTFQQSMPIYAYRSKIKTSVEDNDVTILVAETGSGKSTQLVKYLMNDKNWGIIACTQPRKLAARSLADYVSLSYSGHLGGVVGYDFGFNKRITKNETKIVYTTDYYLLQEWGKDPTLSKYEYIIVDEAHERSLATDLLLSVLRLTLEGKDREVPLKIVITSATIDPTLFQKYFSQLKVNVLDIPGNIYPITLNWDHLPINVSKNYLDRAVSKVKQVVSKYLTERKQFGAMLVFVATPADTERAQRTLENETSFKENDIVILQLHGKLPLEDQQKIFRPTPGKQYVIFTTNIAETSVTVPGVTIVIESGAVKERQYDAKKNVSILKVVNVNQSSSTQRKGRAGRTAPGTCYFLYTKEDFDSFSSDMVPEIKRLPLDLCLLELFKLGVNNPHQFTFMDPPLPDAIENSLQSLLYLEAIEINTENSYTMTDLGKKMSQFAIDPRLSKLLIIAIESGSADVSTALALCAMVSNGGNIFFRQGTDEEKQAADVKKLQFLDDSSDFITMINVFYEWKNSSQSDKAKSKWCHDNFINGKSMKTILASIKEFQQVVKQIFPTCPKSSFENRSRESDKPIMKLITKCYGSNIVVYLGHPDLGYLTNDGDVLIVHPSSSICTFDADYPKYLIYDNVLTTSRSFMLHVSCVEDDDDIVNEFQTSKGGTLYNNSLVSCSVFGPVGSLTFKACFIGKGFQLKLELEKELKKEIENLSNGVQTSFVKLEVDFDNCCLNVWCHSLFHDVALRIIKLKMVKYHEELKNELWKLQIDSSCISLMLARGGTVLEPYLLGDYIEIKVKEPYDSSRLELFMNRESLNHKEISSFADGSCKILFRVPSEARAALSTIQSSIDELDLKTDQITSGPRSFNYICKSNAEIYLEYERRGRSGIGFIEFENELLASMCVSSCRFNCYRAKISKNNKSTVFLTSVSGNVTQESLLEKCGDNYGNAKVVLPLVKAFQSTEEDKEKITSKIKSIMKARGFNDIFYTITLLPIQDTSVAFRFILHFQSIEVGCKAEKSFPLTDLCTLEKSYPLKKHNFKINSTISCLQDVYVKFEGEIEEMCKDIECKIKANRGRRMIVLSSSNLTLLSGVFKDLEEMLNGETIDHPNMRLFFNESNWNKLCKVQSSVKVVIRRSASVTTPAVILIGKQAAISSAKIFMNNLLGEILNQDICHYLTPLNDPSQPKGILKKLIRTYDGDLKVLRNMEGLTDVNLILGRRQKLEISGHKRVVEQIKNEINNLIAVLTEESPRPCEEECAICFTEPEKDEKYRFELCGHLVCRVCFQSQLSAAELPLTCPKENCREELCVQDYRLFLKENEQCKKAFMQLAVNDFMSRPDNQYFNCPSPDCVNLFRKAEEGRCDRQAIFCCGDCDKEICTRCCVVYHNGYTCEVFQLFASDEDASLKLWLREDPVNRKQCTECGAGIEKISGCNHMTCIKCKSHLCWRCMRVFSTGMQVYTHQPYCEVVY